MFMFRTNSKGNQPFSISWPIFMSHWVDSMHISFFCLRDRDNCIGKKVIRQVVRLSQVVRRRRRQFDTTPEINWWTRKLFVSFVKMKGKIYFLECWMEEKVFCIQIIFYSLCVVAIYMKIFFYKVIFPDSGI